MPDRSHQYLATGSGSEPFWEVADRGQQELDKFLSTLQSLPDFVRLTNFPDHCFGPVCWCRPDVISGAFGFIVRHKNLSIGEFDS